MTWVAATSTVVLVMPKQKTMRQTRRVVPQPAVAAWRMTSQRLAPELHFFTV